MTPQRDWPRWRKEHGHPADYLEELEAAEEAHRRSEARLGREGWWVALFIVAMWVIAGLTGG